MTTRTRPINGLGIGFKGIDKEIIKDIRIYPENGSVQIWVEMYDRTWNGTVYEAMQYLSPEDAMRIAKALERCSIQVLKELAECAVGYIFSYGTAEEAHAAYAEMAKQLHGEFANHALP